MLKDPNSLPALADDVEDYLTSQNVNDETRYIARKYFKDWGKASPHFEHNGPIQSWPGLFIHARGEEAAEVKNVRLEDMQTKTERRKARASKEQFGTDWLAWQAQCTQRNTWIESLGAEWRKRIAARKTAMAEWDAFVDSARAAYQDAKLTPAPAQPVKVAQ